MTKEKLEQIELQLSELDARAMSFDHKDAEQCKLALMRIVEKAAKLCGAIKAEPSRDDQLAKSQRDYRAMIEQVILSSPLGPGTREVKPKDVSIPAKTITVTKSDK